MSMEIVIAGLAVSNLITAFFFWKAHRKINKIAARSQGIDEICMLLNDINHIGAGLLEVRRVNPNHIMLHNPR